MRVPIAVAFAAIAVTACSPSNDLPLGKASAARFHQQLNVGQFEAIYAATSPEFKQSTTEATFTPILAAVHRKLGAFKVGVIQGWNDSVTTSGHILSFTMNSQFEKGMATESFTFAISGNAAPIKGYNINSTTLILN